MAVLLLVMVNSETWGPVFGFGLGGVECGVRRRMGMGRGSGGGEVVGVGGNE